MPSNTVRRSARLKNRTPGIAIALAAFALMVVPSATTAIDLGGLLKSLKTPRLAEGDVAGALTLPVNWKLADGPSRRGWERVKFGSSTHPRETMLYESVFQAYEVARLAPVPDEWSKMMRLAEPLVPARSGDIGELVVDARRRIEGLKAAATPADLQLHQLLREKRLQIFTLADISGADVGNRDEAWQRLLIVGRQVQQSSYLSKVAEAYLTLQSVANQLEPVVKFAKLPPLETAQYAGLQAVLNSESLQVAAAASLKAQAAIQGIQAADEPERRALAPYVSEPRAQAVLDRLIAIDAPLSVNYASWVARPEGRENDISALLPYCLSEMPPVNVLRQNFQAAVRFDSTYGAATEPMLARLRPALTAVPNDPSGKADALLADLRKQRGKLGVSFSHYTAFILGGESRKLADPALVTSYKSWVDRVSAAPLGNVTTLCYFWENAVTRLHINRWNARSYPAGQIWKPSAVFAMLTSQDVASTEETNLVLRANQVFFGDLVASQSQWKEAARKNVNMAVARMGDAVADAWKGLNEQECAIARSRLRDQDPEPLECR